MSLPVRCKAFAVKVLPPAWRHALRSFLWSALKVRVGPSKAIDLSRTEQIRTAEFASLSSAEYLEKELLPALGLNDEGFEQIPAELYPFCGRGLRCWQYPCQFSHYLVLLSRLGIRSYLEIGVRHGGTFVTTVEYLSRFTPIERAVAVDLEDCPALLRYAGTQPGVRFLQMDSRSPEFASFVQREGNFDAVLIDGDHTEEGCWQDFELLRDRAAVLAFHDIVSDVVPGVGAVWNRVRREAADVYEFFEFTAQYASLEARTGKQFLGIGVAIRKERSRL